MKTLTSIIESVLFVSGDAVSLKDIADKTDAAEKEVLAAAKTLQKKYDSDSGINLLIFNKKLQFCSNPDNAEAVSAVLSPIKERELSRSMLEVAAIIAYKQPVTRIDLEELRGSNSEFAIQNLLKLGVIEVVGRKDTVGKPVLFGTTDEFLKRFQISCLDELPDYDELIDKIAKLRSPSDDNYLFRKDVYVEEGDENAPENFLDGETAAADGVSNGDNTDNLNNADMKDNSQPAGERAEDDSDEDLPDISEEEIPDFLQGEDVDVIK